MVFKDKIAFLYVLTVLCLVVGFFAAHHSRTLKANTYETVKVKPND